MTQKHVNISDFKPNKKHMAQSLARNYLHIIFSTKHRLPFIDDYIEHDLFSYLGGICNNLESYPVKIGGYLDHVHILCLLSKKIALMKFLEQIKSHSSKWIKGVHDRYRDFYWQDGYGAFSVTPSEIPTVSRYIECQREHHQQRTFKDEFRDYLHLYDIEYDERYVWD